MGEESAAKLRQRALWCRALAHGPCSEQLARQLELIAREYEVDAERVASTMSNPASPAAINRPPEIIRGFPGAAPGGVSSDKSPEPRKEVVGVGD